MTYYITAQDQKSKAIVSELVAGESERKAINFFLDLQVSKYWERSIKDFIIREVELIN